jgi:hypothetical protein
MFFDTFFEKRGFFFSHFEIMFKYNFLAVRIFYYDGFLMTGIHTFYADFYNRYNRRSYFKIKRRSGGRLLGSRCGRIFLGLFYTFFSFCDFFKPSFVKTIRFKEGLIDFRKFSNFHRRRFFFPVESRKSYRVLRWKAIKRSLRAARDMKILRTIGPEKFFIYDYMFDLKRFTLPR